MVAAVMAVVHMAACMAVPPPAWPPALPSRTFVLVVVLVLVLGDSAIGDANGALGRGRFWATAPPPSAPFRFPNPSCSRALVPMVLVLVSLFLRCVAVVI